VPPDFRRAVPLPVVPPGRLLVRGDNDRSADSRSFGLVDAWLIVGTVIRQYRGPARPTAGSRRAPDARNTAVAGSAIMADGRHPGDRRDRRPRP
jgi:hypothetical protein